MGGEQAAETLTNIQKAARAKRGESWPQAEKYHKEMLRQYEEEGHPYFASSRLWDDGVIDPADTRNVLGLALQLASGEKGREPLVQSSYGVFRM
jgi:3-methylcrotonyl-CoA carboxylase beta subunit